MDRNTSKETGDAQTVEEARSRHRRRHRRSVTYDVFRKEMKEMEERLTKLVEERLTKQVEERLTKQVEERLTKLVEESRRSVLVEIMQLVGTPTQRPEQLQLLNPAPSTSTDSPNGVSIAHTGSLVLKQEPFEPDSPVACASGRSSPLRKRTRSSASVSSSVSTRSPPHGENDQEMSSSVDAPADTVLSDLQLGEDLMEAAPCPSTSMGNPNVRLQKQESFQPINFVACAYGDSSPPRKRSRNSDSSSPSIYSCSPPHGEDDQEMPSSTYATADTVQYDPEWRKELGEALMEAAYKGEVREVNDLILKGADVNYRNARKRTPLHNAALGERVEVISLLIESGANIDSQDELGRTSLHTATQKGNELTVAKLIAAGAKVNVLDDENRTPMHTAAEGGSVEVIRQIINKDADVLNSKDKKGVTPLMCAILHHKEEAVFNLISSGAHTTIPTNDGTTPLHYVARYGNKKMFDRLIEARADVNKSNDLGEFPLHWAVLNPNIHVLKTLIKSGAKINSQDRKGDSALHWAARKKKVARVQALLTAGASKTLRNTDGEIPYDCAKDQDIRKLLQP